MVEPKIFCGNGNILPIGYDKLGSRLICVQRGYGIGTMLEQKARANGTTKAIEREQKNKLKLYCGYKKITPLGYDRNGTRYECLKRGIGRGIFSEAKRFKEHGDSKRSVKGKEYREEKEYKEEKESKSNKRSSKKSKKTNKKSNKRSNKSSKKKSSKKLKKSSSKKTLKKQIKKAKISSYNKYIKNNYSKVKKKYNLKTSPQVFKKLANLWSKS